jgi:hypothetical protein
MRTEDGFFDYQKQRMIKSVELLPLIRIRPVKRPRARRAEFQATGFCQTTFVLEP